MPTARSIQSFWWFDMRNNSLKGTTQSWGNLTHEYNNLPALAQAQKIAVQLCHREGESFDKRVTLTRDLPYMPELYSAMLFILPGYDFATVTRIGACSGRGFAAPIRQISIRTRFEASTICSDRKDIQVRFSRFEDLSRYGSHHHRVCSRRIYG